MGGDFREEVIRNNVILVTTDGVFAMYQPLLEAPNMYSCISYSLPYKISFYR